MQIRGTPRNLLAGEPFCAPEPVVLGESYIHLIRKLHATSSWTGEVNACLLERLNQCRNILPPFKGKWRTHRDGENSEEEEEGEKAEGENANGESWIDENHLELLCKDVSAQINKMMHCLIIRKMDSLKFLFSRFGRL